MVNVDLVLMFLRNENIKYFPFILFGWGSLKLIYENKLFEHYNLQML